MPRDGQPCDGLFLGAVLLLLLVPLPGQAEDLGLRVAPGFQVSLYADQDLANDIYAMTLDAKGRVVVTSAGYVKVLHDSKGLGRADKATLFTRTATGGMGMCFAGNDLYFCGDGWFSRYRDRTGKGRADGPPEHFIPLAFSEHGGHAVRQGPDGYWYIIGGNDSGIGRRHVTMAHSPIPDPEAGALLRLTPDCRSCQVIADGFRNPYDFDFNAAGDLFTYDSDCERDFFLPWYTPTRVYHIGYGGHHGWHLHGYQRSWARPDYYLDTEDILWPVGRGSPTGVVCYRHHQFPEHYRGGLFMLDWTFGKVYFLPLRPDGASYRTKPEIFLESTGTHGFDPTDVAVAPDGSLFICMGGRHTQGAVYRVAYVGDGQNRPAPNPHPASALDAVLDAPQPLDAWSRAQWMPIARKLGPEPFAASVRNDQRHAYKRVRAVEVMTELFGGLPVAVAQAGARASSPLVRARVAWSLGRKPCYHFEQILRRLAGDSEARVRREALAALADHAWELDADFLRKVLPPNLADSHKRVRQAAARLTALLPAASWNKLWADVQDASPEARLSTALAAVWRKPHADFQQAVLDVALSELPRTRDAELRLQAVRLIMLALGDYHWKDPPVEVYTAYSLQPALRGREKVVRRVLDTVGPLFPSGHQQLDLEVSRLLAMLEDDDSSLPSKIAALWTKNSSATTDMHYLVVFSRLRGPHDSTLTAAVANAVLGLGRKLQGQEQRDKQSWNMRLAEVVHTLMDRDPRLADVLLRHRDFVRPGHVALAACLNAEHRLQAAWLFQAAAAKDLGFVWSGALIDLLALLPAKDTFPLFRTHWDNFGLRDALLLQLAKHPEEADRDKFLFGLASSQPQVVESCLRALQHLPRDATPQNLVPVLRLLRSLQRQPNLKTLRAHTVNLLVRQTGRTFAFKAETGDQNRVFQPVFDWFERRHPKLARTLNTDGDEDPDVWNKLLKSVAWAKGRAAAGEAIFQSRGCATCHAGAGRLGPDLTGVTNRFSRDDLFSAIIYPSRDVAPLYRTTVFATRSGQVYSGIVAFESADGVILQTGATTTVRLANSDILSRAPSDRSLMPDGLLKGLKPADLADLYRYLQTLQPAKATDKRPPKGR